MLACLLACFFLFFCSSQAMDWQSDPMVMKNIVLFYTKAKAFEQLSAFFDAYAQMEIDEVSNQPTYLTTYVTP